jgi:hypothetical protein
MYNTTEQMLLNLSSHACSSSDVLKRLMCGGSSVTFLHRHFNLLQVLVSNDYMKCVVSAVDHLGSFLPRTQLFLIFDGVYPAFLRHRKRATGQPKVRLLPNDIGWQLRDPTDLGEKRGLLPVFHIPTLFC